MQNLRTFLEDEHDNVWRLNKPVRLHQNITALQQTLDTDNRYPIIFIEKPQHADDKINPIPVVCNLTASREITARALGVQEHRDFAASYAYRTSNPIEPISTELSCIIIRTPFGEIC